VLLRQLSPDDDASVVSINRVTFSRVKIYCLCSSCRALCKLCRSVVVNGVGLNQGLAVFNNGDKCQFLCCIFIVVMLSEMLNLLLPFLLPLLLLLLLHECYSVIICYACTSAYVCLCACLSASRVREAASGCGASNNATKTQRPRETGSETMH